MGAIFSFFGAAALGPAQLLRLKALVIGAAVMVVVCLSLMTWALIERTGKLQLEVEAVTLRTQNQVLADSLGRCNAGVENAAKAGTLAVTETRRLLDMAARAMERTATLRNDIRGIVSKPAPVRPDGKPKDCTDALKEIRAKMQP